MQKAKFDFSGYATKFNIKCADGRVIRPQAFKESDGLRVPLVWQHFHDSPENILGHALLEYREDGVYAYAMFNDTTAGKTGKELVKHGDITGLSIYANKLAQNGSDVVHGVIREISLVLSGANPGALIENVAIAHGDGSVVNSDDEAIISFEFKAESEENISHEEGSKMADKTAAEIFDTLSEEQKVVVYALIAEAMDNGTDEEIAQSEGDSRIMKKNVFDSENDGEELRHTAIDSEEWKAIVEDAKKVGSLKTAFLAHAGTYGIDNIDYLFPDAKAVMQNPTFIKRRTEWVGPVIDGAKHSPFSRIKSLAADITADAARAKGYVKGNQKTDEVFGLLKRTTGPTTVYKKQKLDRDDIVDITDINVVAFMKGEMRLMLDEELARAALLGDGRAAISDDKIDETCIRPIYKDDALYAHRYLIPTADDTADKIDHILKSRAVYEGSGSPVLFCEKGFLSDMLLLKDTTGRRLYNTEAELASALRVSRIVEVGIMTGVYRVTADATPLTYDLLAIMVNMADYVMGADAGGSISMFDDFDIDYNQYKYLIETRMSGALVLPKSAVIFEQLRAAG